MALGECVRTGVCLSRGMAIKMVLSVWTMLAMFSSMAMPSEADLKKSEPEVMAVVGDALKRANGNYGKAAVEIAGLEADAGGEAERYLLRREAVLNFLRGGKPVDARKVLMRFSKDSDCEAILSVDDYVAQKLTVKEKYTLTDAVGYKDYMAYVSGFRTRQTAQTRLSEMEAEFAKNPKNAKLRNRLAMEYACGDDWAKALPLLSAVEGAIGKAAQGEMADPKAVGTAAVAIADAWWNIEGRTYAKKLTTACRHHAVEWYRKALEDDGLSNLVKARIGGRIDEMAGSQVVKASSPMKATNFALDLGCPRKLELIVCKPGTFMMGERFAKGDSKEVRRHKVKITRPFWLSKVPVTVDQWNGVFEQKEEENAVIKEPPIKDGVLIGHRMKEKLEFFARLNEKFADKLPAGYVFRLPTEAEAAYALTAGGKDKVTRKALGFGKETPVRWSKNRRKPAGGGKANSWGFLDIIGHNDLEFLDIVAIDSPSRQFKAGKSIEVINVSYADEETDPLCWDSPSGEADFKTTFNLCGDADEFWKRSKPDGIWVEWNTIIRVCLGPDLVAEKVGR